MPEILSTIQLLGLTIAVFSIHMSNFKRFAREQSSKGTELSCLERYSHFSVDSKSKHIAKQPWLEDGESWIASS